MKPTRATTVSPEHRALMHARMEDVRDAEAALVLARAALGTTFRMLTKSYTLGPEDGVHELTGAIHRAPTQRSSP